MLFREIMSLFLKQNAARKYFRGKNLEFFTASARDTHGYSCGLRNYEVCDIEARKVNTYPL
jgi:hypothetical protein